MSLAIQVTKPDGTTKTRTFDSRRDAAKFGVAYYLTDNGYATQREATTTATAYERDGTATFGGFTFEEVPV